MTRIELKDGNIISYQMVRGFSIWFIEFEIMTIGNVTALFLGFDDLKRLITTLYETYKNAYVEELFTHKERNISLMNYDISLIPWVLHINDVRVRMKSNDFVVDLTKYESKDMILDLSLLYKNKSV